jgi:hypothetical protein
MKKETLEEAVNKFKKTAVEWLIDEITNHINMPFKHFEELKEQAKEMEKQQTVDAYIDGVTGDSNTSNADLYAERYYNEIFNSNKEL